MASAKDLREVVSAARPLIEQWLDIAEQIAALRDMATDRGLDWSQIKALVKAQVQDERAGDTKRVQRIIEKAEFASAYADMLGLSEKVNENIFSGESRQAPAQLPPHDPETGEIADQNEPAAATDTAGDYLREPAAVVPGQIVREGGAPRETDSQAGEQSQGGSVSGPDTDFSPPAFLTAERKVLRPNCLNPSSCASYGPRHCHTCTKAAEAKEAA